ncbi:MAG: strawberry notch family protein, partial [Bacteroidales bacterium]|nr:strawberry notch family protein [Bacteroidales bacterium]
MTDDKNKRKLYDALSQDYDMGSYEQFSTDVEDEGKRRKLYDAIKGDYDLPDFDGFTQQLIGQPTAEEEQPASAPSPASRASQTEKTEPVYQMAQAPGESYNYSGELPSVRPPKASTVGSRQTGLKGRQEAQKQSQNTNTEPQQETADAAPLGPERFAKQMQMDAALRQRENDFHQRMENIRKGNQLFGSRKGVEYNPATGKVEDVYYTKAGEAVSTPIEQRQRNAEIDEALRPPTVDEELQSAYDERDSIDAAIAKRTEELDAKSRKQYDDMGFWARMAQGLAATESPNKGMAPAGQEEKMNDPQLQMLWAAKRQNQKRIGTLERERGHDGFMKTLGKTLFSFNNWDFGLGELMTAGTLLAYGDSKMSGAEGEAREAMMRNTLLAQEAEQRYGSNDTFWQRAGEITGSAIPFVVEFVGTGGGYSAITKGATNMATKAAAKMGANKFGTFVLKNTGRLAGDMASGFLMANTTGSAKTMADIMERHQGQVVMNENGDYSFDGGKSWSRAIYEGEMANTIEYFTEKLGSSVFDPVLGKVTPQVGRLLTKGAEKIGASRLSTIFGNIRGSEWIGRTKTILGEGGIDSYLGEVMEEESGILLNAMLTGDNKFSDLWDKRTQADIWGGMMMSIGFMKTPSAVAGTVQTGIESVQYHRFKHNTDIADRVAESSIGGSWGAWRDLIDGTTNEKMADVIYGIIDEPQLDEKQKGDALNYIANLMKMRGYNLRTTADAKDQLANTDEDGVPVPVEEAAATANEDYTRGYEADEDERRNIVIDEVMGDGGGSNPAAEGMRQRIEDDADLMVAEEREEMKKRQHGDGTVHPATLKELDGEGNEKQVFIVDGNVVMDSEGNVDLEGSDRSVVVYDPEIGKRRIIDPTGGLGVSALGEVVTQEMFEADLERRKQAYIQQQMDDAQGKVSVAVGETVTVPGTDAQGTVVAVSEDGEGLTVQLEDGTQVPVVRRDLQEVADRQAIEEYEATRAEQADNAQPEPTATMVEGAPESYEPGMTITIRDYDGQEKQGVVNGRGSMMANDGRLEYVPDGTGNIVEYEVDGEVRRDRIDQMGEKVVGYSEAVETAPVNQEEPQPVEEVAETEQTAEPEATEAEPMPMFEDGEADYMSTTPERGHQYIYGESGLDREEAGQFVKANIEAAEKELGKLKGKTPKMGTSLTKYQQEKAEHQQQVEQAQAVLDYWNGVRAEQQRVVAAERAEQAERDRAAHDAAVQAEQERQAAELAKQQEQAARGANAVHPAIREKWDAAAKVEGAENEITLANGETLKGRYMLVESGAATPSHNATSGFARSEGFPVDENGQTVNDRDYERDQNAQLVTRQMADQYDSRAIQNVPVVSRDGVVLSGNGRTMAGELAAQQNSDGAYIEHLRKYPQQFGFTPEQVEGMQHPRVVFVPDVDMPYTTETFAKFNQQDMKSQSRTEQSVKMGKTVDDATFGRIVRNINAFDTLGDFYNDPKAAPAAIGELHKAGAINQMQVAEMMDGEKVSGQGRQMLENMLIGKAFEGNPDAVRQLAEFPAMRQSIVSALAEVANNIKLGEDYSLESELAQAINLAYQARKSGGIGAGEKVSGFARQQSLFPFDEGETVADYTNATVLMLADCLNDDRVSQMKKVLAIYNDHAAQSAAGQYDIFSGGVKSKEEIINDVLNILNNGTETEQQTALDGATERRKEAAGVGQDGVAGNSDAGSGAAAAGQSDLAQAEGLNYQLSDEVDENGRQFVLTNSGELEFGVIGEETGLTAAPILLSEGIITNPATNDGYGLVHIEARHGDEIRRAGYASVIDFIEEVAKNYEVIREGKNRDGIQTYMLQLTDKHNNTLMVELSGDGTYWNINTAGIFKTSYGAKRDVVYNRHTTDNQPAETDVASLSGEPGGTTPSTSMDATAQHNQGEGAIPFDGGAQTEQTPASASVTTSPVDLQGVSERKDTNNSETEQEKVVSAIKSAEAEVNTNPTEGQKKAGNYKMGHVKVDGYDITIENPKGSVRRGTDPSGKAWEQEMHNTYGYIKGTVGFDKDHLDIFLSDDPTQGNVYVVDQVKEDGTFDEHKIMYGFPDTESARQAYLSNYEGGWQGLGAITPVSKEEFKKWIESSKRKMKPFSEYRSVETLGDVQVEKGVSGTYGPTVTVSAEAPYSITPTQYTTKKGKVLDVQLVKFADELTSEQKKAASELNKELRGWWSREDGGYLMRSEDDARRLVEALTSEEGVADAQPLSLSDMAEATDVAQLERDETQGESENREQEQQPNTSEEASTTSDNSYGADNQFVSRDRYEELKKRMRQKLGGQMNMGIDPEILAIGTEMAVFHIEAGARKFADFAKRMIVDLGDAIRPYLKAFYEGARNMPEMGEREGEMTPYDEVRKFDVENFDKEGALDIIKTAETIAKEQEVVREAEDAEKKLKAERNEQRKSIEAEMKGRGLRRATQADLEDNPLVFVPGRERGERIMLITNHGEQLDNGQFSKPTISSVMLTDGKSYDAKDLWVKDEGEESKPKKETKSEVAGQQTLLFGEEEQPQQESKPTRKAKSKSEAGGVEIVASSLPEDQEIINGGQKGQAAEDVRRAFSGAVTADMLAAMERGEKPYRSIGDLRKRAESVGMTVDADGRDDILLQELVEDGLVRAAREVVESGKYGGRKSKTAYDAICRLYDLQPTIAQRSSNRIKMQQYSTPLPMAFVADMFAYKPGVTTILEPTAGNGMLVFAVPANDVVVNELDETRLANLREQGFLDVKNLDALEADFGGTYDAVIANPPFGNAEAKMYDGKEISGLDPQITLNALSHMKSNGRAAIIIGGNMEYASNGSVKDKKPFWTYLYNHYNVKGVVDMDGKLYAKQGTTYPTRMILIDGVRSDEDRAQSTVYPPKQENAVRKAETFEDLYDIVNEIINSKEKTNGTEVLRTGSMPVEPDTDAKTGRTNTVNTDRKPDANADNGRNGESRPTDGNRGGSGNRPVGQKSVSTPTQPSSEGVRQSGDAVVSGAQADNGGRTVSGGESGRGERGGDTGRVQPDGVRGAGAVGGGVRLGEEAATVPQHTEPEKRTFDEEKLPYRPHNSAFSLESVAPAAMVEAMDNTLSEIEKTYGQSVDQFVTEQLGYDSEEEMHKALAAEQVDSVAMALHQMSQGNALIIGDQTGVGKGRQMAALIRWAVRAGKKPIFITQKADLFSDIYRDLVDVGSGDLRPFIFNSDGAIVDSNGAVVHKPLSSKEQLKIFADGELPEGYDFAVLTYSQVNTGDRISRETKDANGKRLSRGKSANKDNRDKPAPKADFLRQISRDNYLFLDESHTAAGDSNIGAYIRSIIGVKGDGVKAVTFASATFAKRPDTMPMYALRTAMSQANVEPDKLISIIEKGGVTLQEIMSRALTESGQMVRRERDMSDVRTDWETVTDPATVKRARDNYDKTIEAFNAIIKFQEDYVKPMIDQLDAAIADRMETAQVKRGTNKMGVENVPFASKTYNYTKQLMLALKADAIVDRVEQEIKAGRHPVIALESTMEASLKDYAIGEAIDEPTFSASLLRGLDNCMQYTIKDEDGKETHRRYKPSDLGPEGEQAYYQLQDLIREATKDVFISP